MNYKKLFILSFITIGLTFIHSYALGGPGGKRGGGPGGSMKSPIMLLLKAEQLQEKLQITPEQLDQIQALAEEMKAGSQEQGQGPNGGKNAMKELQELGQDENATNEQIYAAADKAAKSMADRIIKMREMKRKLNEILTPEQQQMLDEMKNNRGPRGGQGKGKNQKGNRE